jgi:hypothetical protein
MADLMANHGELDLRLPMINEINPPEPVTREIDLPEPTIAASSDISSDTLLDIALNASISGAQYALAYAGQYYNKIPRFTSILSGQGWVNELLEGHPLRISNALGVSKVVFTNLVSILASTGWSPPADTPLVSLEMQLAIFLHACASGLTTRHLSERFQLSEKIISWYESFNFNVHN